MTQKNIRLIQPPNSVFDPVWEVFVKLYRSLMDASEIKTGSVYI